MANMTRVPQGQLTAALGGNAAVADAIGNVVNGSAMNGYQPVASSGSASGVWASIGTLIYVEITLTITASGKPTVTLPFTHQPLSDQRGIIPGASANGVMVSGVVGPESSVLTLSRYDGAALDAGTFYLSGCYESSVG
ncbi:hypothetical protein [Paraburkholderia sp. BL9I2N2]|uniref:hypothetical protein n=1 Tax=Paraburkholderia sp. BL9I2N2 TaxID=1938809 RepID=UPI0010463A9B|nr:hypothetical protein [Paraburkholderia sp. BL9I2N2]TCK87358.1 hypothetical protein B0G74_7897 [Paraburkholderia sp. BL9I2N2]